MRICHVSSAHYNNDTRILYKQCVSLRKAGHEVYFVVQGPDCEVDGVRIVGLGECEGGRLSRMTGFARKAYERALSLDCDVYELHDPELLPYAVKLGAAGKKVVFDCHEDYVAQIREKEYIPSPLRRVASRMMQWYERRTLKRLDAVIFTCPSDAQPVLPSARRVVYLDNLPLWDEVVQLKGGRPLEERGRIACHVGSLTYNRGISHLVEAMEGVEGRLLLAGRFSSDEYAEEVASLPGFSKVECLGYLDREGVVEAYEESRVGVCTLLNVGQYNQSDNFPTKVYEYMAAGLPVVMSDSPYARRVVEEHPFALLVDPADKGQVAEAINGLFDDVEMSCRMGEAGRSAVLERYNWSVEERKLLALYDELGGAAGGFGERSGGE